MRNVRERLRKWSRLVSNQVEAARFHGGATEGEENSRPGARCRRMMTPSLSVESEIPVSYMASHVAVACVLR